MNYERIYTQIIQRANNENRSRNKSVYFEKHHIIPKCIGGDNSKENLVFLTPREHFICHWILVRIYTDNSKLHCAFWNMCNGRTSGNQNRYIVSGRQYQEAKELYVKVVSIPKPWISDSNIRRIGITRPKIKCQFCSHEVGSNNIKKHETACHNNPNKKHTPNLVLSLKMLGKPNSRKGRKFGPRNK